MVKKIKD